MTISPRLLGATLVALSLGQLRPALRDGAPDPSPNAGVSQAAYAHAIAGRYRFYSYGDSSLLLP